MNTLSDILRLAGGDVVKACHDIFDGHESIQGAIDYWVDFPHDSIAFTPHGWEINQAVAFECAPLARIVFAAEKVLDNNSADLDTDTRTGCWVIGQDVLRELRDSLKSI